jgi:hypothetical protein
MHMSILLLALALAAPADHDSFEDRSHVELRCSLQVHALDDLGQPRSARRISAAAVPAVVIRGRVEPRDEQSPPLLFDVYTPRGLRYQVLLGTPRVRVTERHGERVERTTRTREAALAVAGSSIELTSMYGRWRVEPRLEGEDRTCGRPEFFTIAP